MSLARLAQGDAAQNDTLIWNETDNRWEPSNYLGGSIENLLRVTKDIHIIKDWSKWVDADDTYGDLAQVQIANFDAIPPSEVTLTDAMFDNMGSDITISAPAHAETTVYIRVTLETAKTKQNLRVVAEGEGITGGNGWIPVTGPTPETYKYYYVSTAGNNNGDRYHLQRFDDDVFHTEFQGDLAFKAAERLLPKGGTAAQILRKKSGTDGDTEWVDGGADGDHGRYYVRFYQNSLSDANPPALPDSAAYDKATGAVTLTPTDWGITPPNYSTTMFLWVLEILVIPAIDDAQTNPNLVNAAYENQHGHRTATFRVTGHKGAKGNKGDTGAAGAAGADGATGPRGPAGADGQDGMDGEDGGGLHDFDTLPAFTDYEVGDIVAADDQLYKLGITDDSTPNLYEGTVGREIFRNTGGEEWRGIANNQSPNGFSTDGDWTANPDNALSILLADNERHIRVAIKQSVYEAAKGSAFNATDRIAIKVTYPDGDTDEAVLAYYNIYTRQTKYIIWQHRHATDNYNLWTEDAGNAIKVEFFTVSSGTATTTHFLTHAVSTKHWLDWYSADDHGYSALSLAQANAARLDALDVQVEGEATPIHTITYDDTTALLAPLADNAAAYAVSTTWTDVQRGDLAVIDWTKCDHLNHHDEHVVPGSNTDAGRMYVSVDEFNSDEWDGEFIYGLERALQDNSTPDTLNSWIVGAIEWSAPNLTFGLHLQQGGSRTNRNLKARAGFSITLRLFRNTSPELATSNSLQAQLKEVRTQVGDLSFRAMTQSEYDAIAMKDDDTIYFIT